MNNKIDVQSSDVSTNAHLAYNALNSHLSHDALRARAEAEIRSRPVLIPPETDPLVLIHELRVHQVELEMQNETLRATQAVLQASHDRYLDLYELSPVGYLTLAQDGRIDEANMTAANLFGVERESLIERRFASLLASEDADRWHHFFKTQISRGGRQNAEFNFVVNGNGEGNGPADDKVCIRIDCLGVRREHLGLAVHVALTDITERKRAEAALSESEARYHAVFDKARNGLVVADVETRRFVDANDAFLNMIGCSRERLLQLGLANIQPESESPEVNETYDRLAAGALTAAEAVPLQRLDGSKLWVDINGSPFMHDGARRILGEFHDTTARKQAEDALREQEAFFRLIAENIDGFVAVLDVDGRRVYNSPSYERLLGAEAPPGGDSFAEVHPEDRERVAQAFQETVNTGVGQHLEYRFAMTDGGVQLIESRGGVIHDAEGHAKRVVVVSHDITARKEADARIHHLAFYDALTQLPNRLTLNDRLQRAMAGSKRSGRYGALMFVDLDHFKPLNDAYGHGAGDRLLIQSAERLSHCVREIDTVARFGGDEFVVILAELDEDDARSRASAEAVAEKIRTTIAEPYILEARKGDPSAGTIEHHCTASIGIVLFLDHDQSEDDLIKNADIAMYCAKQEGRNRIRFAAEEPRCQQKSPAPPSPS